MKKVFFLAISSLLLFSCNNTSERQTEQKQEAKTGEQEHNHNESSEMIELNMGQKWLVNNEMKPFVTNGEQLVALYIKNNKTDYKFLANQLKEENSQLIKSCTMKGKSHDELHKWLHPHLELVKSLENETDPAIAAKTILEIQNSYKTYHSYFE